MDLFFQLNVFKKLENQLQGYCGQYYNPILLLYLFHFFHFIPYYISDGFSSIHFLPELLRCFNLTIEKIEYSYNSNR